MYGDTGRQFIPQKHKKWCQSVKEQSVDSTELTEEADQKTPVSRTDIWTDRRLERNLWIVFGVLFGVVALSMYLPVEPIVFVFPFWSLFALAAMIVSAAVAAFAGIGYGWPSEH